jgi:hypothetical protein
MHHVDREGSRLRSYPSQQQRGVPLELQDLQLAIALIGHGDPRMQEVYRTCDLFDRFTG